MFRSRAPRSAVAAALSIVLIAAFMVGTTSASVNRQATDRAAPAAPKPKPTPTPTPLPTPSPTPTPTPNSDNRDVYFGWPDSGGRGQLDPSEVTTGGVFVFNVIARNDDNQNLTHPRLSFGDVADAGGPTQNGLPNGATIIDVTVTGDHSCINGTGEPTTTGFTCDLPSFGPGDSVTATFTIQAGGNAVNSTVWASFKISEKSA